MTRQIRRPSSTAANPRRRLKIGVRRRLKIVVRRRLKIGSGGAALASGMWLSCPLCVQSRGVEEVLLKAAGVQECLAHPLPLGS